MKEALCFYLANHQKDRFETEMSHMIKKHIKEQVNILIKIGQC